MNGVFEPKIGIYERIDVCVCSAYGTPPPRKNRGYFGRIARKRREISRNVFPARVAERVFAAVIHPVCGGGRVQIHFFELFKPRTND